MCKGRDYKELERRRLKAADLFDKGIGPAEVSRRLQVHVQTAKEWKKCYVLEGREGLKRKGPPGPRPKLGPDHLAKLRAILLAGATAYGFETNLWTCPRLAAVIQVEFSVRHDPSHVWRILDGMGFSCQVPEKHPREQDPKAIAHWKRYKWPHIKKKPWQKGESCCLSTRAD
jgi:transposase